MKAILASALLVTISALTTIRAEDDPKQCPDTAKAGAGGERLKEMMLQKFDANKNGTLDPDEKAAAMKAMQERRNGTPKGEPGTTSPGTPKAGEPGKAILLQKFDANKNGIIDPEEREAAMKAVKDRKGKTGGFNPAPPTESESGSKFRRPPEAPKEEGDAAKK